MEKRGIGIVLGVGFKQVRGICTLFYESSFVFFISFSCDLLKRKKKEKHNTRKDKKKREYKKKKFKKKKMYKQREEKKYKKMCCGSFSFL